MSNYSRIFSYLYLLKSLQPVGGEESKMDTVDSWVEGSPPSMYFLPSFPLCFRALMKEAGSGSGRLVWLPMLTTQADVSGSAVLSTTIVL